MGGSHQLPGKLEKAFERFGGTIRYRTKVLRLLFKEGQPSGARIEDPSSCHEILADRILYGGTLLNLHENLIPAEHRVDSEVQRIRRLDMTYPSVVLHCIVDREALPEGTLPIQSLPTTSTRLTRRRYDVMRSASRIPPSVAGMSMW